MALLTFLRGSLLVLLVLMMNSCQETKLDLSSDELMINIKNSSGDDFSFEDEKGIHYFAPYPFAQSTLLHEDKMYEVVLLSKKVKRGDNIGIKPLAQFSVMSTRGQEEVIVAVPIDEDKRLFQDTDFFAFTVEKFAYKQLIEHWYANKSGLEGTLVENWRPASIATLSL